uniref:(northern house mosquito) hypothetical protein n=1 Tax=Culex pipiens TaxID=7175 RepID=A0A8D8C0T2_CULPI
MFVQILHVFVIFFMFICFKLTRTKTAVLSCSVLSRLVFPPWIATRINPRVVSVSCLHVFCVIYFTVFCFKFNLNLRICVRLPSVYPEPQIFHLQSSQSS